MRCFSRTFGAPASYLRRSGGFRSLTRFTTGYHPTILRIEIQVAEWL
jgi:hypothetical protein